MFGEDLRNCKSFAGEMIKLSAGWLHAAINVEPTVSIMENFISIAEMPLVSFICKNACFLQDIRIFCYMVAGVL